MAQKKKSESLGKSPQKTKGAHVRIFGHSTQSANLTQKKSTNVRHLGHLTQSQTTDESFILKIKNATYTMSDNNLVETIMYAASLPGLAAGPGWIVKKVVKENFTTDPSSNVMNYAKFTIDVADSVALKQYLDDQKVLPTN